MTQKTTYKSLIFDLDGTLIDSATDLAHATNAAIATLGLKNVDLNMLTPIAGHGAIPLIKRALEAHDHPINDHLIAQLRLVFLEDYQANIARHTRPYEGAIAFLNLAKVHGLDLAICTNKPAFLTNLVIDALNLTSYFDAIICPDHVTHNKPHPEHIEHTAQKLNHPISNCLMIGDTDTDYRAARAAHMDCILFQHGYADTVTRSDPSIKFLNGFKDLAKELFNEILP